MEPYQTSYKFGIFIHWGVYSVPAFDTPRTKRKIQNGSEWYLHRLTSTFRVSKADKATREYHSREYPNQSYRDLARYFTLEKWDPLAWVELFKRVGAEYIVITARHHDGYTLWPSKYSPGWSSKRDILGELKNAIDTTDLAFGIYYSWLEWNSNGKELCTRKHLHTCIIPQLFELIKYKPSIWWWDGDWPRSSKHWDSKLIVEELRAQLPSIEINDRLGKGWEKEDPSLPTYRCFQDRAIPDTIPINPSTGEQWKWEHVNTIGQSWGRNRQQKEEDYKTVAELIHLFIQVICKGGRFLLNVGPNPDGTLDEREVQRLEGLGKWIQKNNDAIHGTIAGPLPLTTTKNKTIYQFYLEVEWTYKTI
jgi:alpha-L-fucosidase